MSDVVSVLTTPHRPQYLNETLRQLLNNGASTRVRFIYCDGLPAPAVDGWPIYGACKQEGCRKAMWRVFRQALELDADRLLYCEDDIQLASRMVDLAFAIDVGDRALVSLFDRKEFSAAQRFLKPGLYDVPLQGQDRRGLFGAVCLLIPRHSLEWLVRVGEGQPGMPEGADTAISWALRESPWQLRGVSVPSLVEHIGDVSSMGHQIGQRAAWFAGRDER